MNTIDPLVAAFGEYAANKWDSENWRDFGRSTGAGDILTSHPRLYRSMGFGDDDYPDAAREVIPQVLKEATGPSDGDRMAMVAEFVPDLVEWVSAHGTYRTKKLFNGYLAKNSSDLPEEWVDAAGQLSAPSGTSGPYPRIRVASKSTSTTQGYLFAKPQSQAPKPSPKVMARNTEHESEKIALVAPSTSPNEIFIVHGRDTGAVDKVKIFVHKITGVMPQILADQPGSGDTIIEKFEREAAKSDYAIVLLTADDEGRNKADGGELKDRARQNVILELGYFFGKLGRSKVVVLNGGVEQPSDVHGLNYIAYPGPLWMEELRGELSSAGFTLIA